MVPCRMKVHLPGYRLIRLRAGLMTVHSRTKSKAMVKKLVWGAGAVFLLGIAAVVDVFNKPHASVAKPEYFVAANELIAEFEEDEPTADKKYVGKAVEVTGRVTEVMEKDNSFVILLGDSTFVSRVSCTLQGHQDSMAYGLRKDDMLTVRGIGSGRRLDVILTDCNIVENDD